jgi:hypothetical protein
MRSAASQTHHLAVLYGRFVAFFRMVLHIAEHKLKSYTPLMLEVNELSVGPPSRLYLGDCLDMLELLSDSSVELILTDPPYGIDYRSRSRSLP